MLLIFVINIQLMRKEYNLKNDIYSEMAVQLSQLVKSAKNATKFLTLYRMEDVQALFIVSHWPTESLDTDCIRGSGEEGEEFLGNASELSTAPLNTQTHDC